MADKTYVGVFYQLMWLPDALSALCGLVLTRSTALLFTHMKEQVDDYVTKYGSENPPPPWQVFTIGNEVRDGNLHVTQKVFMGAFEVSRYQWTTS